MTKETAKAIKQLIPNQDKALMMCSSINSGYIAKCKNFITNVITILEILI